MRRVCCVSHQKTRMDNKTRTDGPKIKLAKMDGASSFKHSILETSTMSPWTKMRRAVCLGGVEKMKQGQVN